MSKNVQKAREAIKQTQGWKVGGAAPKMSDQIGDKVAALVRAVEFLCDELDERETEEHNQ